MSIPQIFQRHCLFWCYMALGIVLTASLYLASPQWVGKLFIYYAVVIAVYAFACRIHQQDFTLPEWAQGLKTPRVMKHLEWGMHAIAFLFPLYYYTSLGYLPFIKLLHITDYYQASGLRRVYFDELGTIAKYTGEYYLRGIMPVWLVYCYLFRRKIFYVLSLVLLFHTLNLITKVSFLMLFAPLLLIQLCNRKWLHAFLTIVTIYVGMGAIVVATQKPHQITDADNMGDAFFEDASMANGTAWSTLWARTLLVPGIVTKQWFETFPRDIPFMEGCGYRWIATIKGCDYVKAPDIMWMKYYGFLHKKHKMKGTVTASHFMNGYANFGMSGLVISGFIMAMLLVVLSRFFQNALSAMAFNATFLAMSLEAQLSTLLHSGGWALTIIMYWLWLREREPITYWNWRFWKKSEQP